MAITYLGVKSLQGTKADRVVDSLGSSADGINSGVTLISGIQKYADLDGSNDYINLGGSASDWNLFHAPSGSCEYSVSMWIKLDTVQYTQIFTTEDNSEANGVVMYVNSSTQVGIQTWYGGSHNTTTITTSEFEAGKWYHLVITRNGGTYKIYKDGTEYTGSSSATGNTNDASYVPRISGNHGQTNYRLDGGVSQVIVYTDQLTQSEVTELYNSGTPVSDPTTLGSDGGSIKAWYKFESDANDSHGSLNGTATGVTWISDAFKLGSGCYSFDGSNDKVETGDKFGFLTQTGSIAFWMKPTTFNDNDVLFDSCNASSSNSGVLCKVASSSNLITFLIARGGSSSNLNYTFGSNPSGKWTHLAFTYDGTTAKIYENGSEVASGSVTSTTNTPTHNLHFGEAGAGQDGNYDGLFDDIGIWNRVLTATEISDLVNAPNSWWVGGTSKSVTIDGNTVTTGSGSAWANWVQGKAVTAPTTLEFSVDDTNTNCIVGFGTGTGADSPSAGSPMKHCAYLTSGGDIFWSDSTGETDTGSNRAAGDTYKLVWQSNGNLDLYLKPSGGSYGSSLKSWTSVTGTLYPMVQGYGGIVVTMLPTETADGALVSSLTDKSGLKAYYSMDSTSMSLPTATVNEQFADNTGWTLNSASISNNSITVTGSAESYKSITGLGKPNKLTWDFTFTRNSGDAGDSPSVLLSSQNSGYGDPSSGHTNVQFYLANGNATWLSVRKNSGSGNVQTQCNFGTGSSSVNIQPTGTTRYYRITKNGSVWTMKKFTSASDRTNDTNAEASATATQTSTADSTWNSGSGNLIYLVVDGHASGTKNYTVSDVKVYEGVTEGCANDFSSTSDLEAMTNLPTNTIFLQTDDTPSYWWKQSDNTWKVDAISAIAFWSTAATSAIFAKGATYSGNYAKQSSTMEWNGSAWSSGANTNTAAYFCGGIGNKTGGMVMGGTTADAGANSASNVSEKYDGSSWSATGTLNSSTSGSPFGGISSSAFGATIWGGGGASPATTSQSWNNTSWSSSTNCATASRFPAGDGSSNTNFFLVGGNDSNTNRAEIWNGTSWSAGVSFSGSGTLAAGRGSGGAGYGSTNFIALSTDGTNHVYTFDGTSWTLASGTASDKDSAGIGGDKNKAITASGWSSGSFTNGSESWNGTSWSTNGNLTASIGSGGMGASA